MKASDIQKVDLAILGGGINGAGLAALAARSGLSVALFEKGDFASGTSSKSTKLIHGGIRYLEQGRLRLVFEALHERSTLLQNAPHLVHPLPFLLPCYQGDPRPPWKLRIGLWLYDLLAGSKNIAPHRWFSPSEAIQKFPKLKSEGLRGCGLYYDAQVNDSRLVLENILAAEKAGAHCYNYHQVTQLDLEPTQARVFYRDLLSHETGVLTAACLVNATGPWANQTAKLLSENALKLVRPTRGTHIVVPQVLPELATLITTPKDNRVIFVIPWRGECLVGTTDLDDPGDPDLVRPSEEEIQYLLREASRLFPEHPWERDRVIASFAGLRPLAWSEGEAASALSREDKIQDDGITLTIIGGKLTTYRSMAEKALGKIFKMLRKDRSPNPILSLPGTPAIPWERFFREKPAVWASTHGISLAQAEQLALLYGQRAEDVLELIQADPALKEPLHPERPELLAQVAFSASREKAVHLSDVLMRRLEIGYSVQRSGALAEKASRIMGKILHWTPERTRQELEDYEKGLRSS